LDGFDPAGIFLLFSFDPNLFVEPANLKLHISALRRRLM
jgi:hypothetical protein